MDEVSLPSFLMALDYYHNRELTLSGDLALNTILAWRLFGRLNRMTVLFGMPVVTRELPVLCLSTLKLVHTSRPALDSLENSIPPLHYLYLHGIPHLR